MHLSYNSAIKSL